MISKHLDKKNLHHAYLIHGDREAVIPEVLSFVSSIGVETSNNSDFVQIHVDSFKIEDARNLKSLASLRGTTQRSANKKIFLISANNFLLEAQNSLLKMFEEPRENTHFFVVVRDSGSILRTLASRFYLIKTAQSLMEGKEAAEKFISMPIPKRIDYLKEFLKEEEGVDENGNEIIVLNSPRKKALDLLNALEAELSKTVLDAKMFEHFFKVREFLRMPGSSAKTLMESVALIVPKM